MSAAVGDTLTTVDALLTLPVGARVDTGRFHRERTHEADEWDYVLDAGEVLDEGGGKVTILWLPQT